MVENPAKLKLPFFNLKKPIWLILAAVVFISAGVVIWYSLYSQNPVEKEAPEAQKVMDLQANMPFQILIPAYLPRGFDRAGVEIDISQNGPGGQPLVQLTYRTRKGQTLSIREWVPVNPGMEILSASRPIETLWGKGWLLRQGEGLEVIWVDIGPLRASIYTHDQDIIPVDHLLAIANNMGPASNRQVFNFVLEPPNLVEAAPPPPVEAVVNADGVQEIDLIVTPGGYDPLRIAVKKGIPVRLTFRQLGEVGCGNELLFPTGSGSTAAVTLASPDDVQTLEFTPQTEGQYMFFCAHQMYRGLLLVTK